MFPIFVHDQESSSVPISAMPGQSRWSVDKLPELLDPLVDQGLSSVLLFGVLSGCKDDIGSMASQSSGPVPRALTLLKKRYPKLLLATDVCLCGYTTHGHCGVLRPDMTIDNPRSLERLALSARCYAEHGADIVAPSDMMDGRIGAIKHQLAQAGLDGQVAVMSYSAKFASALYGPFRDAACSGAKFGDRSAYQLPHGSRGLALRAIDRDLEEGADMIMVKPGGPYLDIVRDARERSNVPVAVYQVSGEYAMLYHAAKAGAFDLTAMAVETAEGMKRAGADIIISYFTPMLLSALRNNKAAAK